MPNVGRSFALYSTTLAAAVANNGTITNIPYPTGFTQASFQGNNVGPDNVLVINGDNVYKSSASQFSVTFGGSTITVTNLSGETWPAGASLTLQMDTADTNYFQGVKGAAITSLTSAAGTPSSTVADVGASFTQATLNNNFASLVATQNAILAALRAANITS